MIIENKNFGGQMSNIGGHLTVDQLLFAVLQIPRLYFRPSDDSFVFMAIMTFVYIYSLVIGLLF